MRWPGSETRLRRRRASRSSCRRAARAPWDQPRSPATSRPTPAPEVSPAGRRSVPEGTDGGRGDRGQGIGDGGQGIGNGGQGSGISTRNEPQSHHERGGSQGLLRGPEDQLSTRRDFSFVLSSPVRTSASPGSGRRRGGLEARSCLREAGSRRRGSRRRGSRRRGRGEGRWGKGEEKMNGVARAREG